MASCKLLSFFRRSYCNWCENIKNPQVRIHYPKSVAELRDLVRAATVSKQRVRIVGAKHSATPCVVNSYEDITLVSLSKFHLPSDILIDHDQCTVTVNAGFKLAQLYEELDKHNYVLDTQPASSVFTIGGICTMPVHGAAIGSGLISDSVKAMSLLNENGFVVYKSYIDADFDLYRLNYGLLGVVISVTFQLHQVNNMSAQTSTYFNVFYDEAADCSTCKPKIKREMLDPVFAPVVLRCINPAPRKEYMQCFMDFHNNALLAIQWQDDSRKHLPTESYADTKDIYNLKSAELFFGHINKDYRTEPKLMSALGKLTRYNVINAIETNMHRNRDMFWVSTSVQVYFMSYLIPVFDQGLQLENLYIALEFVSDRIRKYANSGSDFNIDMPMDIRFVTNNDKCRFSPLNQRHGPGVVFAAVELLCTSYNLETNSSRVKNQYSGLNTHFRDFFREVETKWTELGGVPHIAKVFGFGRDHVTGEKGSEDPFDKQLIGSVLNADNKQLLQDKKQNMFVNEFMTDLLS